MSIQVKKTHYDFKTYVKKTRWISYWHQIDEILRLQAQSVLVIGCGDGIVADCLRKEGIRVSTFDIDKDLSPDYVGSVVEIEKILDGKKFEGILCSQVLEHIPFDHFQNIISQLSAISEKGLILSLPYKSFLKLRFRIKFGSHEYQKVLAIPKFFRKPHFDGQHYWGVGNRGYSANKIKSILMNYFHLKKTYLVYENPFHIFFCLMKKA